MSEYNITLNANTLPNLVTESVRSKGVKQRGQVYNSSRYLLNFLNVKTNPKR